jgi:hypothetical protein
MDRLLTDDEIRELWPHEVFAAQDAKTAKIVRQETAQEIGGFACSMEDAYVVDIGDIFINRIDWQALKTKWGVK